MFCSNCGKEIQNGSEFCSNCGHKCIAERNLNSNTPKIILDPSETAYKQKTSDSSKSFSGQGKSIGLILMLISIVVDVVGMTVIGFDAFIPITIFATVLFVAGFFIRTFSS